MGYLDYPGLTRFLNKLKTIFPLVSTKGQANGLAELDASGKVPSSQLPSYVDDVIEVATYNDLPLEGETGKIYVTLDTNTTYRWSGSAYVSIGNSLTLGETSSTAYRGDRGADAYTHAVTNKGSAYASGMYKITTNSEGHVTSATSVAKSDITSLGIPGEHDVFEYATMSAFPATGAANTIYIDKSDNSTYRWDTIAEEYLMLSGASSVAAITDLDVTISSSSWSGAGPYTYTYSNSAIKSNSFIEVFFNDITNNLDDISYTHTNGSVTFTTSKSAAAAITFTVRVFNISDLITIPSIDLDVLIPASGWSSTSPYTYTYTTSQITSLSDVEVYFRNGAENTDATYLNYSKTNGGVIFTAPSKPTTDIPVTVRVLYASEEVTQITASAVSTESISGSSNVEQALGSLNTKVGNLSNLTTTEKTSLVAAINELDAEKGVASGIATLDSGGKVPASQLPSYVDDIESYDSSSGFPATGEDGKIYVAKDTNKSYRWNGSGYTELSTYDVATQSASGLMSAADKTKLDGVATGATANVVSDSLSDTSTTNALSAAKGKELNDTLTTLNSKIAKQDNAYFWGTVVKISGGQAILFPIDNIYLNSLTVNVSKITNIAIPGLTNLSPTSISKYRNCLYVVVSNDLTNYIGYAISMAYTLDS